MFARTILAAGMVGMGIAHILVPKPFIEVVPGYLPAPALLVFVSGVAEVLGGAGLLLRGTREASGWGLAALMVAVFPANIAMALHPPFGIPDWLLWFRLPLQVPLIYWALRAGEILSSNRGRKPFLASKP